MDAKQRKAGQLAEPVLSPELVEGSKDSDKARRLLRASLQSARQQASDNGRKAASKNSMWDGRFYWTDMTQSQKGFGNYLE